MLKPKGEIRSHISKDRPYNGQKKKDNDLQNTTHKTKDRATQTQLKTGEEWKIQRTDFKLLGFRQQNKCFHIFKNPHVSYTIGRACSVNIYLETIFEY
jgi:hypothetical protein